MRWLLPFLLVLTDTSHAQWEQFADPTEVCFLQFAGDQRFASIATKLALGEPHETIATKLGLRGPRETTFEMLANQALPNKREQQAIAAWVAARKECFKKGETFHQQSYPQQIIAIGTEAENSLRAIAADLYNRKISYGAFNKRRLAIADEAVIKVTAVVQQIQVQREAQQREQAERQAAREQIQQGELTRQAQQAQQAQQARDAEDFARRQAAAQVLLNNMRPNQPYQYQPIQPYQIPSRPSVNTNCYQNGNQLNCTTR